MQLYEEINTHKMQTIAIYMPQMPVFVVTVVLMRNKYTLNVAAM